MYGKYDNYVVTLEISTFAGTSFDAEHWYGRLVGYVDGHYHREEVEAPLTAKQAKYLNEKDGMNDFWEAGDFNSRFDTIDDVYKAAKKIWKDVFPNAVLLVGARGSSASVQPRKILASDFKLNIKELDALYDEYQTAHDSDISAKEWFKVMDRTSDAWHAIVRPALERYVKTIQHVEEK